MHEHIFSPPPPKSCVLRMRTLASFPGSHARDYCVVPFLVWFLSRSASDGKPVGRAGEQHSLQPSVDARRADFLVHEDYVDTATSSTYCRKPSLSSSASSWRSLHFLSPQRNALLRSQLGRCVSASLGDRLGAPYRLVRSERQHLRLGGSGSLSSARV